MFGCALSELSLLLVSNGNCSVTELLSFFALALGIGGGRVDNPSVLLRQCGQYQ